MTGAIETFANVGASRCHKIRQSPERFLFRGFTRHTVRLVETHSLGQSGMKCLGFYNISPPESVEYERRRGQRGAA